MNGRIEIEEIPALCEQLKSASSRLELMKLIRCILSRYSLYDLQLLRGAVERELMHLPRVYRDRLHSKMIEQIFGTYHTIMTLDEEERDNWPLDAEHREYWEVVCMVCLEEFNPLHPRLLFLHYLLTAFRIFVMGVPAHPTGTPFPGGFRVWSEGADYYCPVKEREGDVKIAICRFCPAKQDPSV